MQFEELPSFSRAIDRLGAHRELWELQDELIINPGKGSVIPGAGGARKIRMGLPGRGKRGGARVVYYHRLNEEVILLIGIYAKNDKGDLTPSEKSDLAEFIKGLSP
jgi:hypothetical protein